MRFVLAVVHAPSTLLLPMLATHAFPCVFMNHEIMLSCGQICLGRERALAVSRLHGSAIHRSVEWNGGRNSHSNGNRTRFEHGDVSSLLDWQCWNGAFFRHDGAVQAHRVRVIRAWPRDYSSYLGILVPVVVL